MIDPNWRTQRVKPTSLDYRHVDYYGDTAPRNAFGWVWVYSFEVAP